MHQSTEQRELWHYLRWNALLSERHKLLYVATPKVACTTLKWWVAKLAGVSKDVILELESEESDPDLVIHDTLYRAAPRVTGLSPEQLLEPLQSPYYFRFSLVRNPYKRLFSAWQSKLLLREPMQSAAYEHCAFFQHPITSKDDIASAFEEFLHHLASHEAPNFIDIHWAPQADLLRPDLIDYSLIAKIEQLGELKAAIAQRLGPTAPAPLSDTKKNESLIPFSREFITKGAEQLITSLYAKDFEVFGYDKNVPETSGNFSDAELNVAVQAIQLIRGRHLRLTQIREKFSDRNALLQSNLAETEKQRNDAQAWAHEERALNDKHKNLLRDAEKQRDDAKIWAQSEQEHRREIESLLHDAEKQRNDAQAWALDEQTLRTTNEESLRHQLEDAQSKSQTELLTLKQQLKETSAALEQATIRLQKGWSAIISRLLKFSNKRNEFRK